MFFLQNGQSYGSVPGFSILYPILGNFQLTNIPKGILTIAVSIPGRIQGFCVILAPFRRIFPSLIGTVRGIYRLLPNWGLMASIIPEMFKMPWRMDSLLDKKHIDSTQTGNRTSIIIYTYKCTHTLY